MLAKKTSRNQITPLKSVIERFLDAKYFDAREADGRIVLVPMHPVRADVVRAKLNKRDITEKDVDEAIAWARHE